MNLQFTLTSAIAICLLVLAAAADTATDAAHCTATTLPTLAAATAAAATHLRHCRRRCCRCNRDAAHALALAGGRLEIGAGALGRAGVLGAGALHATAG